MHLAKAKAKPRGTEDPWRATTASALLIPSAYVLLSVEPAKPKQDQDARRAMGLATTPQYAPPRVETNSGRRLARARARARARTSHGAKARETFSGAKATFAKAAKKSQPLMMVGALRFYQLKEEHKSHHGHSEVAATEKG